mmetsp:Transcript_20617/g.31768  ORF Transcript_20617/g.31768 Transcript_20617/m.31768 type:complete len:131 (+) Transcript_20617:255-647(+)
MRRHCQNVRTCRKEGQELVQEEMEEKYKQCDLKESMDVLAEEEEDEADQDPGASLDDAYDNSTDIHLKSFDSHNLRGGGPDLLQMYRCCLSRDDDMGQWDGMGVSKRLSWYFLSIVKQNELCLSICPCFL